MFGQGGGIGLAGTVMVQLALLAQEVQEFGVGERLGWLLLWR